MRLYYWIHHTGVYEGGTGVQRVVRNLAAGLVANGHDLVPVRWDDRSESVVRAEAPWTEGLARQGGPQLHTDGEAGTPLHLDDAHAVALQNRWLLIPEVPHVAGEQAPPLAVALDYARFHGLRTAAVFYDLIPLRRPGYEDMARDHGLYARALIATDLLLGISAHSSADLTAWWTEQGYAPDQQPRVHPVLLPEEMLGLPRVLQPEEPPEAPVRFLSVGTVEPRKNQVEALRAFVRLCGRRPDLDLQFDVVGGLHPAVAAAVERLAEQEPRIRLHRYLDDAAVRELTRRAHATVFVSLDEGYGLPIAESLWQGTPCLCSDHGSMLEIGRGGGCLPVRSSDPVALERGLERLADEPDLRRQLAEQACDRTLRTWRDYAEDVAAALAGHPPVVRVVSLAGSRSPADLTALHDAGAAVRSLHWRADSRALLPGTAAEPQPPTVGQGQLRGLWAVLQPGTCRDTGELEEVLAVAQGLGLKVALQAEATTPPHLLDQADLVLCADGAARDTVLAAALRTLPRTVGLRGKLLVASGQQVLEALAAQRPRTACGGSPRRPGRLYYWAGLTAEQPFNSGIQRVTRLLAAALQRAGVDVVPVTWDAAAGRMAHVDDEGMANLARWNGPSPRAVEVLPGDLSGEWLLLPEITVPVVPPNSDVARYARSIGMRSAAIFYDLIPEKLPELYPPGAVDNMRAFWRTFESVQLALPISWTAAADLLRYLKAKGSSLPTVTPCPLAGDVGLGPRSLEAPDGLSDHRALQLLAVGTWEPRKNYPRLLRALAAAQARSSRPISLTLVGRRAGYDAFDAEVEPLLEAAGVDVLDGVDDDELLRRYAEADATVFASWEEGFGLPVVESLWNGRPCVCHDGSALAELAPGGGILALDMLDEGAIADGLVRLADEPGLIEELGRQTLARALRSWDTYAQDVLNALSHEGSAPGWPLPALVRRRPLLTCAITTYNRAPWLQHSLPRLLDATRPWRDVVEVVVCDNTSTDRTPEVVAAHRGEPGFSSFRNPVNVGMLGNLGATARASKGAFVWLLGDDDLLIDGALENVLEGLAAHPEVEMAYLNYAYTRFDDPKGLADARRVVADAIPIAPGGPNHRVDHLREVAGLNENLFTAIYACVFRRDHALRAYQLDTRGAPFTSLLTCVPSSVYALSALQDRPAWWVGEPALVVNMNVSWLRWALLWHLERMPDLFEEAERHGVDPHRLDQYRMQHLAEAEQWVRMTYFDAEDAIRENFSLARLLERCKHLPEFRSRHLPGVRRAYAEAWAAGRVAVDPLPPDELFARYGL